MIKVKLTIEQKEWLLVLLENHIKKNINDNDFKIYNDIITNIYNEDNKNDR